MFTLNGNKGDRVKLTIATVDSTLQCDNIKLRDCDLPPQLGGATLQIYDLFVPIKTLSGTYFFYIGSKGFNLLVDGYILRLSESDIPPYSTPLKKGYIYVDGEDVYQHTMAKLREVFITRSQYFKNNLL